MKKNELTIIMILGCLFFMQPELPAQQRTDAKNTIRSIFLNGKISLDSLTRFVHKQSGIRISFNAGKIGPHQSISFPKGWYEEQALLDFIAKTTDLSWTKFNGYIIFKNKPVKEKKPLEMNKPARRSSGRSASSAPDAGNFIPPPEKTFRAALHFSTVKDLHSLFLAAPNTSLMVLPGWKRTMKKLVAKNSSTNTGLLPRNNGRSPFSLGGFHARPGVSVTEIIYPDVSVELGFERLHLTASAGTNYKLFLWGLGLGSILFRNERSEWQVNASIRFLGKDGEWVNRDTIKNGFRINGKLYNAGISWNRHLNDRWLIKLGIGVNLLRTDYTRDGQAVTPAAITDHKDVPEDQFRLIRAPLLLNNTYGSNKPSNNKTWVGLRFGIFYELRQH